MKQLIIPFFLLSIFFSPLAGQNQSSPSPPSLLSADIIPGTDSVKLTWKLSDSTDVKYYGVFEYKSDGRLITYSLSATDTCIIFSYPAVLEGPVNFRLVAYDSLTNSSPLSNMHTTNFLQMQFDTCRYKLFLQWKGYIGWEDQFADQRIILQYDNDVAHRVKILPPSTQKDSIDLNPSPKVCVWIESLDKAGRVARSNSLCLDIPEQAVPDWISADYASIHSDGTIELSFHLSDPLENSKWIIQKKTTGSSSWEEINRYSNLTENFLLYNDPSPSLEQVAYYRLCITNPCYQAFSCSAPSSTLLLTERTENTTLKLEWNSLNTYPGEVEEYKIYRTTGSDQGVYLGSTVPAITFWETDINSLDAPDKSGKQCFYVEAIESGNNPFNIQGISRSNLACTNIRSRFQMPNAFTPNDDGINDIAGPVFTFYPEAYRMIITDPYGKTLFETANPAEGWDGRSVDGKRMPPGSYLWYISFRDFSGQNYQEYGSLSIITP